MLIRNIEVVQARLLYKTKLHHGTYTVVPYLGLKQMVEMVKCECAKNMTPVYVHVSAFTCEWILDCKGGIVLNILTHLHLLHFVLITYPFHHLHQYIEKIRLTNAMG